MKINGNSYFAYQLNANAIVIEDETETELKAKAVKVDISRTALTFKDVSTQEYYKPELIFLGEVILLFENGFQF